MGKSMVSGVDFPLSQPIDRKFEFDLYLTERTAGGAIPPSSISFSALSVKSGDQSTVAGDPP